MTDDGSRQDAAPSVFERIGGAEAIDRLVESFYRRMETLPEARIILDLHPVDLGPTKGQLKRYLGEWTGGPDLYSAEQGHPRMRQRHLHVPIGIAERDAWLLCMRGALEAEVADPALREGLYDAMARLADWMRNRPEEEGTSRSR